MINASDGFKMHTDVFPGLGTGGRKVIPDDCKSVLDPNTNAVHVLSWAAVQAAARLLTGRINVAVIGGPQDILAVQVQGTGGVRHSFISRAAGQVSWSDAALPATGYAHLIVESVYYGLHPELSQRWEDLVAAAGTVGPLPLGGAALQQASHSAALKRCMYRVADAL